MVSHRCRFGLHLLKALTLVLLATGVGRSQQVTIVNMIPQTLSDETNGDSEPNIAVNPSNPLQMAGSAFTPDPSGGSQAPIYVSTDGGNTWTLNSIVPSNDPSTGTGDITLRFSGTNKLYAGILSLPPPALNETELKILRSQNFTGPAVMKVLVDRKGVDQPYVQVISVNGKDRVYVGDNDLEGTQANDTGVIDDSPNGAAGTGFQVARLDSRAGASDGPQIRPSLHPDGKTVYAAFYGWRVTNNLSQTRTIATADVVVVRDDNAGLGSSPFSALTDPSDGRAGRLVAQGVTVPFINENQPNFGQERVGGDLSIVTDPRTGGSTTIYLAFADQPASGAYTLHLRRSDDSGANWTNDLRTIANAKNPALAVNTAGKVAFLYQRLDGAGTSQTWVTVLERSTDAFANHQDLTLATVPALTPPSNGNLPYNGDYLHMMAVGNDFYGVFPANNTPDPLNFPTVFPEYQRNIDKNAKTLLGSDGTTAVDASIDPFFFKVTES
jgi:hypothetical protein